MKGRTTGLEVAKQRDRDFEADLESRATPILSGEWLFPFAQRELSGKMGRPTFQKHVVKRGTEHSLVERGSLMARKERRAPATTEQMLTCLRTSCACCGHPIPVAYRTRRTITTGPRELSAHPACPPMPQSSVRVVSSALSARGGGEMGLATRRIWSGRGCAGRHAALYFSPQHSGNPSGTS